MTETSVKENLREKKQLSDLFFAFICTGELGNGWQRFLYFFKSALSPTRRNSSCMEYERKKKPSRKERKQRMECSCCSKKQRNKRIKNNRPYHSVSLFLFARNCTFSSAWHVRLSLTHIVQRSMLLEKRTERKQAREKESKRHWSTTQWTEENGILFIRRRQLNSARGRERERGDWGRENN